MTIHERAIAKLSGGEESRYPVTVYLRAFLNDPELVEKVTRGIFKPSERFDKYEDLHPDAVMQLHLIAQAAISVIKQEAGVA